MTVFSCSPASQSWYLAPQELWPTPLPKIPLHALNLWMLDQALAYGMRKVSVIRLWDRQAGDGPGGTKPLHLRRCAGLRQSVCDR